MPNKRPSSSQTALEETHQSRKRRHLGEVQNSRCSQSTEFISDKSVRSGKISRIQLRNFMCHSNLVCEFNNRVNIIIGQNGSGKSAILTALIVGLGAKARSTSRASSLKQLVKTGTTSADIEITITNNGVESYESEVYGNYITICRTINSNGVSRYKIKNERGEIKSTKTDDLHKILLYHNIQTDNPVFVLNQEAARVFLKEMDPSKNYELFLKATQIEMVLHKLNQCGLMYNDYKYRLQCSKKEADYMENNLKQLEEKYERLQSADKIQGDIEKYKCERRWLKVMEQEKIVEAIQEQIEKLNHKLEKYKNHCEKKDSAEAQYKKQISEIEENLNNKKNSLNSEKEKLNRFKLDFDDEIENYQNEQNNLRKIENKLQDFQEQIEELQKSIITRSGNQMEQINNMRCRNEVLIQKLQEEKNENEALIVQKNRDIVMVKETKGKYEEDFANLKAQRSRVLEKIDKCRHEISRIDNSSKDQISVYGPNMGKFLKEIDQAYNQKKFTELPRGPLGRYLSVPNQKWRPVVEYLLSRLISVFVVNSREDQIVFDKIKSKFPDIRISVIKTRFHNKVHDVQDGMCYPPEGTSLLMNEIHCADPVVMNCLIDQLGIETQLLTEDQNLAKQLTMNKENVPRNLRRIILLKPFLEYLPAPLYRTYSLTPSPARFIQVDFRELKKNLQNDILQFTQAKNDFETKLKSLKDKLSNIYRQIENTDHQLSQHIISKSNNAQKIAELESIEYPEENQVEFLKKEKLEIENKVNDLQEDLEKKEKELKSILKLKHEKEKIYLTQKKDYDYFENQIQESRCNIDDMKNNLNQLLIEATTWSDRMNEINRKIANKKDELKMVTDKLSEYIKKAQEFSDRIEITSTDEQLETLIKKATFLLKEITSTDESAEDLEALIFDKQVRYKKITAFITTISQTLELLKRSRLQRFKLVKSLKSHMALRVKYTFDSILKIKNFVGQIVIDHVSEKLTMEVVPRDNHINGAVSNTKSLSGGERSYSTIAFLISLWSCVDHPFYFLDEYDVFTDQINREIMTNLLLKEADKKPLRQYALLTPQDVSFVNASDTVKIHRLAPPER